MNNTENISINNKSGDELISFSEISSFPDYGSVILNSSQEIKKINHLMAQVIPQGAFFPNKNIELVFSEGVQKGLANGTMTMMKTSEGEILADAVSTTTGKITGKGRIVEGGAFKQLAFTSYQIISIAAAQSHLDEINKNLIDIKKSISTLSEMSENERIAKILGRCVYFSGLMEKYKNGDFESNTPEQIKNQIENTISDANEWLQLLNLDMQSLIKLVGNISNSDYFGSGNTYDSFINVLNGTKKILLRRKLIIRLSLLISSLVMCIEPLSKNFSKFDIESNNWIGMFHLFKKTIKEKYASLISNPKFNSSDVIKLRGDVFEYKIQDIENSILFLEKENLSESLLLANNHRKIISNSGRFRLAIECDDNGMAKKAVVID